MTKHVREVWIDAPRQQVWEVLADFGNIYVFNPTVPESHLTSEQTSGVGTSRHCELNIDGASIEERIVEWSDGQSMKIEIYEGTKAPPFKSAFGTIKLSEARGGTLVEGTMEYDMKYGPVGSLMDKMMVGPQFGKAWGGVLAGLKHHLETGEPVNSMRDISFEPVVAIA